MRIIPDSRGSLISYDGVRDKEMERKDGTKMKIIMIECDADEIKANRTLFDSITDAVRQFTSNFRNETGITSEMLAALHRDDEEEDADEEKDTD